MNDINFEDETNEVEVPITVVEDLRENFIEPLFNLTAKLTHITTDMYNEDGGYSHASLGNVIATVKPLLAEAGLIVVQETVIEGERWILLTRLVDRKNRVISSVSMPIPNYEFPQIRDLGATLTYLRRYSIMILLGLATEDSDGKNSKVVPIASRKQSQKKNTKLQEKVIAPATPEEITLDTTQLPTSTNIPFEDFVMSFEYLKSNNKLHLFKEDTVEKFAKIASGEVTVSEATLINARDVIQRKLKDMQ